MVYHFNKMHWRKVKTVMLVFMAVAFATCLERPTMEVKFEALKNGGFRAYIPDQTGITKFKLSAAINRDSPVTVVGETKVPSDGFWVIHFNEKLAVENFLTYSVRIDCGGLRYGKDDQFWKVSQSDVRDTYSPLTPCESASTTLNGKKETCVGKLIISDEFDGTSINTANWIVEQKIAYQDINYYLNTYEDREDTRFIKDGILHLKPVAIHDENEVRSPLDLTNGCTSKDSRQCIFRPTGAFYLPSVKSAKITSKIPFKYGKVDIRAKLPAGEWIIPVIELELVGKTDGDFSPKIVIAYSRGNDHLTGLRGDDIGSRILYAGPILGLEEPQRSQKLIKRPADNDTPYYNDFHLYTLKWVPGNMSFFVDSRFYGSVDTSRGFAEFGSDWSTADAPFNKECLLSLGVAVGGADDFPDSYSSGNHPRPWDYGQRHHVKAFFDARSVWSNTWVGDNTALQIDYVKVWAV